MSVEPSTPDETAPVEPVEGAVQAAPAAPVRPAAPGSTPEGLGSERPAAPFTSETDRPVQGVTEALGNTGVDESETADPA
jgi:hypothetical protein